jgi:outer membrane lipoprotein-sorting protein
MLLLLAGAIVLSGEISAADVAEMSAADVIKKSEAAYAAVKTYVGTTTMRVKTDAAGVKSDKVSTAKITFQRPGKLRIEGKSGTMDISGQGGYPYAIVSDGKTTWKSTAIQNNSAFSEAQNLQMAGASVLSLGVAEGIPAALMKSDGAPAFGHDPFLVARASDPKVVGHERIDDADCYKLAAKNPKAGDVTLWIDSKSFLLRQMTRETSESQMAAATKAAEEAMKKFAQKMPARPANAPVLKSQLAVFSFTIDKVDGPVDAKLFSDPTKK